MTSTDSAWTAAARVIPAPRHLRIGTGQFRFDAETRVFIENEGVRDVISPLVGLFSRSTGFALPIVADGGKKLLPRQYI